MPTRKKVPQPKKGSIRARKLTGKVASGRAFKNGPVPPYGVAIREAIARGDLQEMKNLAATTRKYLNDVSKALDQLERLVNKTSA